MATNGAPPKQTATPNQTLYVSHLNDAIHKTDMRRALYCLFSTYGIVLDVVALKTMKMRGQAHIVFQNPHIATQAMRALQGFEIFGKEMRIAYGRGKSHMISRLDGTAAVTQPPQGMPGIEQHKSAFGSAPVEKSAFGSAPSTLPNGAKVNGQPGEDQRGVKRPREDEGQEEEQQQEASDDDAMEMSDDDD